jgi:hypothetical protein
MTTTYTVTVTDANGCTDTETKQIEVVQVPSLTAASNSPVCVGSSINLTATFTASGASTSATAWSWSGPNSFTSAVEDPTGFAATAASAGTYTVQVTDNNGCTNTATTAVIVDTAPVLTTAPGAICLGSTINLVPLVTGNTPAGTLTFHNTLADATNGVNALVNTTVAPSATRTYYVRSTSAVAKCFTTAAISITVNPIPNPMVSNGSVCVGSSIDLASLVTLDATGGSMTFYNTYSDAVSGINSIASSVSPASAKNYYVRVMTAAGCFIVKEITIVIKPAVCAPIQITGPN